MRKHYLNNFILFTIIATLFILSMVFINRFAGTDTFFLNKLIFAETYVKELDKLTDIIFYLIIGGTLAFLGILEIINMVKNKSIKPTRFIVFFAIAMVLAIVIWIGFDKFIIINPRPIIQKDEGSCPSTHVFVSTFLLLVLSFKIGEMLRMSDFKGAKLLKALIYVIATIIIVMMCIFRVRCGMHYFSDTIAGVLVGLALYNFVAWNNNKEVV